MFEEGHKKFGGREKGVPNRVSLELFNTFLKTLEEVEEEEKISFFKHIIREAFKDPKIGIGILKKLLPDKVYSELEFSPEGIVRKVEIQLVDTPENSPKREEEGEAETKKDKEKEKK